MGPTIEPWASREGAAGTARNQLDIPQTAPPRLFALAFRLTAAESRQEALLTAAGLACLSAIAMALNLFTGQALPGRPGAR